MVFKGILGQVYPAAGVLTNAYVVPLRTNTSLTLITIANHSASDTTFRISIARAAEADTPKQYISYNNTVCANDSTDRTLGVMLRTGDVVRVYSISGTLSFNIFGVENQEI